MKNGNGAKPGANLTTPLPPRARSRGWRKLDTPGDLKRFLRFLILEAEAGRLDMKKAATLAQIGCYLLKAIEVNDLETRLDQLEAEQDTGLMHRSIFVGTNGHEQN